MILSLENDSFDTFGLSYITSVYHDSKKCIEKYLDFLSTKSARLKGLEKAAAIYGQIVEKYHTMNELFPFSGENGAGCMADRTNAPALLKLARECSELESQAMSIIAASLQ